MAESLMARALKLDSLSLSLYNETIKDLIREYRAASEVLKALVKTATDESGAIHPWATQAAEWLERNGVKR